MTRRHFRLLVALVTTAVVAGAIFGSGTHARQAASGLVRADSAQISATGNGAAATTAPSVNAGVATPHVTQPLRTIAPQRARVSATNRESEEAALVTSSRSSAVDGALQTSPGHGIPAPSRSFEGLGNVNATLRPDTAGDVGPNNYMEFVNLAFAIYSKSGTLLYGPAAASTLFPGQSVCGSQNMGDAVVIYDQFAGRWIASQSAVQSIVNGPYYQCIAVSQSE